MTTTTSLTIQETPAGGPANTPSGPAPEGSGGLFGGLNFLPLVLIFAIFWFVMIAPERKNRKKREAMLKAMKKGDKVMTTGGMFATVAAVQEDVITLQIADGVRPRFARSAVQSVVEDEKKDGEEDKGSGK
jgi:preprotein translocase subunit YajC